MRSELVTLIDSSHLSSCFKQKVDLIAREQNRGGDPTVEAGNLVGAVNGDTSIPSFRELELTEENKVLRQEVSDLRAENEDLGLLAQDYEAVLEKVLEGLRVYAVCDFIPSPLLSTYCS
jgi:hypothetical protein